MDRCTETLVDAEYIGVTIKGGAPAYNLTKKFLENYEKESAPRVKEAAK
jgi:hypothetical protein